MFFVSAFAPALLSVAAARLLSSNRLSLDILAYAFAGVMGIAIAYLMLTYIGSRGEVFAFTAKKIESNDALIVAVFVTYVLPFALKAKDLNWKIVLWLTLALAIISHLVGQIPPHVALRLLRVRFYKVESSSGVVYTLLTRRELLDPKNLTKVRKISSSMLLEVV